MRRLGLLLTGFLSACSAAGPVFDRSVLENKSGATLVIYRVNAFQGSAGYFDIDVNGIPACKLLNASFYISERPAGDIHVSSSIWNSPGTSRIRMKAEPHHRYFVRMEMDGSKQLAGALGGLSGQLLAEGMASTGGPFIFTLLPEQQALEELKGLNQDCL